MMIWAEMGRRPASKRVITDAKGPDRPGDSEEAGVQLESEIIVLLMGASKGRGHQPDTGPDRPRAPDEAGVPLESEMGRNHRSVNRSFNRPGTPARNRPRPAQGPR